jgi:hypothetical protein
MIENPSYAVIHLCAAILPDCYEVVADSVVNSVVVVVIVICPLVLHM